MNLFKQFLLKKNDKSLVSDEKIQSFTYYIPGPPDRKSSYREKQFDLLFTKLLANGHQVVSFTTVPHSGVTQSGMWIVALLKEIPLKNGQRKSFDELEMELENEMRSFNKVKEEIPELYTLEE